MFENMNETITNTNNNKGKKLTIIIISLMIIIAIIIIGIIAFMTTIKDDSLKIYIDGQRVSLPQDTIVINDKIYVDIKGIASYLGYEAHNGEYKVYSEDTNKCYVNNKNETASFYLNSNKISKVEPVETEDYEDYTIKDVIISRNNKLYCSDEGIRIGFNVTFDYNQAQNQISIYTLPYLVTFYEPKLQEEGYTGISKDFNNQKAILYDMFVVDKKDSKLFGVINSKGEEIISSKYQSMTFNESLKEFYVKSTTNKVGIVTTSAETKINLYYDDITMLDKEQGLYLVRNNSKYGVLDNEGKTIVHLEYSSIGVKATDFPADTIKNRYLLFENAIPVCQNGKWGAFDIKGNLIIPVEYDVIGYTSNSSGNTNQRAVNNLLIVPNYKAIVFGKQFEFDKNRVKKYALIDYKGKVIVDTVLDSTYSVTSSGENTYYMEHNGQLINIEEYIDKFYETIYGVPKPSLYNNKDQENTNNMNNTNIDLNLTNTNNVDSNSTATSSINSNLVSNIM